MAKYSKTPRSRMSVMLNNCRKRAAARGVPFNLRPADLVVPSHCPFLGIPLIPNTRQCPSDNSPSVDAIIPELGYVPGNVMVISFKANRIKSDASWQEIMAVAKGLRKVMRSKQ
jgi:hypothetical protein